jgi:ribonuclease HII
MFALRRAMREAVAGLRLSDEASEEGSRRVLIDGKPMGLFPDEETVIKGDRKIACIAAASVLAKTVRDELMIEADARCPDYGFASNKGYASAQHIKSIVENGLTPWHRRSFCEGFFQKTLF